MGKKNIIFWGFQKNIENFYNKADVFFAPLFAGNGLKVKIVNAIMNGLPVITTPIGAEGFGRLKNKYLFICKNKMDYIDSLTTIVNNKSKTKEMVLSAQKHIKNTMNLDVISKQLEKIYNSP